MDKKHAFCIMAYNNWSQLQKLINCIDDVRNDIFLHVDAKSAKDFAKHKLNVSCASLHIIDNPVSVWWSDISLADAEVALFAHVINTNQSYHYVHLLSGTDMPLKNQDELHHYFKDRTEEFIQISFPQEFKKRLRYYHLFVRGRRSCKLVDYLRKSLLLPQWFLVDRLNHSPLQYAYGSEWCSLTLPAIAEIVGKYNQYRYLFKKTTCCDEHYKQMILYSSRMNYHFAKEGNLRFVLFDKNSASPRVLSMEDYENMLNSGCLFARKFKEKSEIFEKVLIKVR